MILTSSLSRLIFFTVFMCLHISGYAADPFGSSEPKFLPVSEAYQVRANLQSDEISFDWSISDGYYLYEHQFSLKADSQKDDIVLRFQPAKKKFDEYFQEELNVFYKQTQITASLPSLKNPYHLRLTAQGCADAGLCYPPEYYYFKVQDGQVTPSDKNSYQTATTPQVTTQVTNSDLTAKPSSAPAASIWYILGAMVSAMLGGMILNLMPCVFPVLSLKALSFASANKDDISPHHQGWSYTAGVVISFLIAAVIILIAKSAGNQLGWGFQLQQPSFVAGMAYLFFAMGLSLSGMFHIGTQWMGAGQKLTSGHGLSPSFFTGVLAAVVASPCTAPLMAPAIGFAFTQSNLVALLIFASLGFGMALPFLALSYSPKLASYLPKPGAWMDTLKQILAFPLYLTSVWLLWVLGHQTNSDGISATLLGAVSLTFGIWLLQRQVSSPLSTWVLRAIAIICFVATFIITPKQTIDSTASAHDSVWQSYTTTTLSELRANRTPVFVDLTADWCLTCKVNEKVALTQKVTSFAHDNGIALLQGDWTRKDPEISALLEKFERNGVPLYLMYSADPSKDTQVLPQILTENIVLDAMKKAL